MTTSRHPSIQDIDFGQLYRQHMAAVGRAKPPSVWDARADGIKPPSANDPYTRAFVQRMDLSGCETLLDVGCGAGNIALAVAPSLRTVVGLDYSPRMLALFQQNSQAQGAQPLGRVPSTGASRICRLRFRPARVRSPRRSRCACAIGSRRRPRPSPRHRPRGRWCPGRSSGIRRWRQPSPNISERCAPTPAMAPSPTARGTEPAALARSPQANTPGTVVDLTASVRT